MEKANLAVWKEYKEWIEIMKKNQNNNFTMIELMEIWFPNLWKKLILKLEKAIIKDNFIILPKNKEWELI